MRDSSDRPSRKRKATVLQPIADDSDTEMIQNSPKLGGSARLTAAAKPTSECYSVLPFVKMVLEAVWQFAFDTGDAVVLDLEFDTRIGKGAFRLAGVKNYGHLNAAQLSAFLKAGPMQSTHHEFMKAELDAIKPAAPPASKKAIAVAVSAPSVVFPNE